MVEYDETSIKYCYIGCGQMAFYKLKKSGKYTGKYKGYLPGRKFYK